jgi:hypothetical protein
MAYICSKCGRDMLHQSSLRKHLLRKIPCVQIIKQASKVQIYDKQEIDVKLHTDKFLAVWLWNQIVKTQANICFVIPNVDIDKVFVKREHCVEIHTYLTFMDIYIRNVCHLGPGANLETIENCYAYEDFMKKRILDFFDVMPNRRILLNRIKNMDPSLNYL